MRITIVGNQVPSKDDIRSFSGMWSYYLAEALRSRDIEVVFAKDFQSQRDKWPEHEHVFVLRQRYTETQEPSVLSSIRTQIKGALVQFYDMPQKKPTKHLLVDCAFSVRDDPIPRAARAKNFSIGWAADPVLFQPHQSPQFLRILIDHPYYGPGKPKGKDGADISRAINLDVGALLKQGEYRGFGWSSCEVKCFAIGRFTDFEVGTIPEYHRATLPITDCAPDFNQAHVFIVTHSESVGQTALECATAGALVVAPKGFLPPCRLRTIRHVEYDPPKIRWNDVLQNISPGVCRSQAIQNSWDKVADRVIGWFKNFRKDSA